MTSWCLVFRGLGASTALFILGGCGQFYNAPRAELAGNTAASFTEIGDAISVSFGADAARREKLLAEEQAAVGALLDDDRTAGFIVVATSDEPLADVFLERMLRKRLSQLGLGGNPDEIESQARQLSQTLLQARGDRETVERQIETLRLDQRYAGELRCEEDAGPSPLDPAAVAAVAQSVPADEKDEVESGIAEFHKRFAQACRTWQDRQRALMALLPHGEGREALADKAAALAEREEARARLRNIQATFNEAERKLKAASGSDAAKKPSELLAEEIAKIRSAISGARDLAGVTAEKAALDARLARLDGLLAALVGPEESGVDGGTTTESTAPGDRRVTMILAGLPGLVDELDALQHLNQRPPRTALTILRGALAARRDAVLAELRRQEARLALADERFAAVIDEIRGHNRAALLSDEARGLAGRTSAVAGDPFALSYMDLMNRKATDRDGYYCCELNRQCRPRSRCT